MNADDARTLRPGSRVQHRDGDVVTLDRRKEDGSGWWLTEPGGLSDRALQFDEWQVVPQETEAG